MHFSNTLAVFDIMVTFALPPSFTHQTEAKRDCFLEEFGLGALGGGVAGGGREGQRGGSREQRSGRGWRVEVWAGVRVSVRENFTREGGSDCRLQDRLI